MRQAENVRSLDVLTCACRSSADADTPQVVLASVRSGPATFSGAPFERSDSVLSVEIFPGASDAKVIIDAPSEKPRPTKDGDV